MKLGAMVGMRDDPDVLAAYARGLEDVGVEYVWTGEAYSADAVSIMGFLAAVTKRVQIGSSILPLYSRTPTLLAMTAVGLDKLSRGRTILGLGASGPQVIEGFHGVAYDAPLARTREIIEICRSVWRRDRLVHQGPDYRYQVPLGEGTGTGLGKALKIMDHPVRERIPIYVASLGPRNVEMTAELAEGWLPLHYWPERAHEQWGSSLEAGAAKRAPDMPPLEIVAGGSLAIGNDVEPLRDRDRPMLALYFGGMERGARTSTTTSSGATATKTRPSRFRTPTSQVTASGPRPSCRRSSSPACPSSATRAISRSASRRTGSRGSPSSTCTRSGPAGCAT